MIKFRFEEQHIRTNAMLACVLTCAFTSGPIFAQAVDAFRISDMDLRDPHVFINFIGCRDITDTPLVGFAVNPQIQTAIQTDGDGDGLLDLSTLIEFFPLDQALTTSPITVGSADCSSPIGSTTCGSLNTVELIGIANLSSAAQCLSFIPNTIFGYTPSIISSGSPCFVSPLGNITIDISGIQIPLRNAQLAATLVSLPADTMTNGLMRGFVTEAVANNIIIPNTVPLVGSQPLSSVLPGGTNNCAPHDDKDIDNGEQGWWFYLNFSANRVQVPAEPFDTFANGFANDFE